MGLVLYRQCFGHGQCYVAMSRVERQTGVCIFSPDTEVDGRPYITNVVFPELLDPGDAVAHKPMQKQKRIVKKYLDTRQQQTTAPVFENQQSDVVRT